MSNLKVKLNSRSGDNYLQRVENSDDTKWVLRSDVNVYQTTRDTDGSIKSIDPSGGPMITVGHKLKELERRVVRIAHYKNIGFVITVK